MKNLWLQRDKAESIRDLYFSLLAFEDDAETLDFSDMGIEKSLYMRGLKFFCQITNNYEIDTIIGGIDFVNLLKFTGLLSKEDDEFILKPSKIDYVDYHGLVPIQNDFADVYTIDPYSEVVHLGSVCDTRPKFWTYVQVINIPEISKRTSE